MGPLLAGDFNQSVNAYPYNPNQAQQVPPFEEGNLEGTDLLNNKIDKRWMFVTVASGKPDQSVLGTIGPATDCNTAIETRPRNFSVKYIIKVK